MAVPPVAPFAGVTARETTAVQAVWSNRQAEAQITKAPLGEVEELKLVERQTYGHGKVHPPNPPDRRPSPHDRRIRVRVQKGVPGEIGIRQEASLGDPGRGLMFQATRSGC